MTLQITFAFQKHCHGMGQRTQEVSSTLNLFIRYPYPGDFLIARTVLFLHLSSSSFSVDGKFSTWSSWGVCSNQCGDGTQTRSRTCNNPTPAHKGNDCQGNAQESQTCKLKECPGNDYHLRG